MMLQMSQLVYQILSDFDTAQGDPLGGDVYPLIGPLDAKYPLAVYQVSKQPDFSKRGIKEVNITILLIGKDHDQLCSLSDSLEDYIAANHDDLHFQSAEAGVNPDDHKEFNITIKYNAKMIQ